MKKRMILLTVATMMTASLMTGCGCGREETPEEASNIPTSETVSESNATVVDLPDTEELAEDETLYDAYEGRRPVNDNLAHSLVNGYFVDYGSLSAERTYFEYLESAWIDETWNDESKESSDTFYESVVIAVGNGLYEKLYDLDNGATLAGYGELEDAMATVYTDIKSVENETNETYAAIALCDMAGINGVNFGTQSKTSDSVNLGVVINAAAIIAKDVEFRTLPYVDGDNNGSVGDLFIPATGHDYNYAMAAALGLDTTDAKASLEAAGYSTFEDDLEAIAISDYDLITVKNLKVLAAANSQTTTATEESQPTTDTTESQPTTETPAATETPVATEAPAATETPATPEPTPAPAQSTYNTTDQSLPLGSTVYINGVAYTYGGVVPGTQIVVDNPAFYNHPEAAIMTCGQIGDKSYTIISEADNTIELHPTWSADGETRVNRIEMFIDSAGFDNALYTAEH